jgi:hypothetical protein
MQRIDIAYVYELGDSVTALGRLGEGDLDSPWAAWAALTRGRDAIFALINESVFSRSIKTMRLPGHRLLEALQALIDRIEQSTWDVEGKFSRTDLLDVKTRFAAFEPVLTAELQSITIFHVPHQGALDPTYLTEMSSSLFPDALARKAPETERDVDQGAKAIAFALWTAMGFHFLRVTEAVERRYYQSVIGKLKQPKHLTMGTMLSSMNDQNVGDANIKAALTNITVFHRNPIAHPDQHIESGDEAMSLYAAARAAIGYMLDKLPEVTPPPIFIPSPLPPTTP